MSEDPTFQFPADLDKAKKHRLANRIFKGPIPNDRDDRENMDRCECCCRRVGVQHHKEPFCYSPSEDLGFLGPGVTLFFTFIQIVAVCLLAFTLIFSIYAFLSNLEGESCDSINNCFGDIFSRISLSNNINNNDSITIQAFLISGFLLVYIILRHLFIYRIRRQSNKFEGYLVSPSDYSIIIKRMPQNVVKSDIEAMVEDKKKNMNKAQLLKYNNLTIAKIIFSYSPEQYIQLMEKQEKKFLKTKKKDRRLPVVINPIQKPTKTGVFAIVVFEKQVSRQVFAKQSFSQSEFKMLFSSCCWNGENKVKGKSVIVQRAPQPDDLIWQNAGMPVSRRYRNIILSNLFGVIILGLGGLAQYYLQSQELKERKIGPLNLYSYLSTLVLILESLLIEKYLEFITKKEGNLTKTQLNRSLMQKTCAYQFVNIGILFLVAHFFAEKSTNYNIQTSGFAFSLTIFVLINSLWPTVISFGLTKLDLINRIRRYFLNKNSGTYTQKQANQIYEQQPFEYAIKYAYVIKKFWITLFYAPFVPSIVFISIGGLLLFYFTEKELIRTSYKIPSLVSVKIAKTARRLLDLGGLILLVGQLLIILYVKYYFRDDWRNWQVEEIVSLSLALGLNMIVLFFPAPRLNAYLFPIQQPQPKQDYINVKRQFEITYELANPYAETKQESINSIKRDAHEYRFIVYREKSVSKEEMQQRLMP